MSEQKNHRPTTLAGYVRRNGGVIKVSINVDAFKDCVAYTTSDGQSYVALEINLSRLNKIIDGEKALTTIVQQGVRKMSFRKARLLREAEAINEEMRKAVEVLPLPSPEEGEEE